MNTQPQNEATESSIGAEPMDRGDIVDKQAEQDSYPVEYTIRRILVALDASLNSKAALAAAIGVAETFHSEIVGLFVEDINLLRLADLPFAREVRFGDAGVRQFEPGSVQRRLRARAAILRRELEESAAEHKISSTFRVLRGPVDRELLAAAVDTDLVALGRLGHSLTQRARLGSTAQTIVTHAASAVLLVNTEVEGGPVIVLFDGSAAGQRALSVAAALSGKVGDLRVLVWGLDDQSAFERRQFAAHLLEKVDVQTQYQHLAGDNPAQIIRWINRQKGSLLIMGGGEINLPADIISTLLEDAEQHILVIR